MFKRSTHTFISFIRRYSLIYLSADVMGFLFITLLYFTFIIFPLSEAFVILLSAASLSLKLYFSSLRLNLSINHNKPVGLG